MIEITEFVLPQFITITISFAHLCSSSRSSRRWRKLPGRLPNRSRPRSRTVAHLHPSPRPAPRRAAGVRPRHPYSCPRPRRRPLTDPLLHLLQPRTTLTLSLCPLTTWSAPYPPTSTKSPIPSSRRLSHTRGARACPDSRPAR